MTRNEYANKFKDPRWQKKRLEIFNRDNFTCQSCGSTEVTPSVHHRFYQFGKEPWDYDNRILVTLCEDCHDEETASMKHIESSLLEQVKTLFLSNGVLDIAHLFNQLTQIEKLPCSPSELSRAISWYVEEHLNQIVTKYLHHKNKKASK